MHYSRGRKSEWLVVGGSFNSLKEKGEQSLSFESQGVRLSRILSGEKVCLQQRPLDDN